tara:strand:- start:340 stop:561 length:222 start_codon:yes stop_codon:yes gene_type:complete
MKAVKGKNDYLSFISGTESRVFNKVDLQGFTGVNTLNEQEQYIAEELYKKDVLQKIEKGAYIGYKTYPQKKKL